MLRDWISEISEVGKLYVRKITIKSVLWKEFSAISFLAKYYFSVRNEIFM